MPSRAVKRSRSRDGFTLVELLVVLAIIGLLLALIMAALGKARDAALQVQCAARLRTLGQAYVAYAGDNRGRFPGTGDGSQKAYEWVFWEPGRDINQSMLAPYIRVRDQRLRDQFCCPAASPDGNIGFAGKVYPLNFSRNWFLQIYPWVTLSSVRSPSHKILVYDEDEYADDDHFWYLTPRDTIASRHGSRTAQRVNHGSDTVLEVRRMGNALFFDSHVELVDNDTCHMGQWNDPTWP